MKCVCGRPIREADWDNTPHGYEHADERGGVICEEGYYDEEAQEWHDPLFAEPVDLNREAE